MLEFLKVIPPKVILILSCSLAVIADMLLVWYSKHSDHNIMFLVSAVVLNFIGILIWVYSMKVGIESAIAISVYALFTVIGCTCLGYFAFGEVLSPMNILGIVLGLIALFMMIF